MTRLLTLLVVLAAVFWLLRQIGSDATPTARSMDDPPQFIADGVRWQRFDADGQRYLEGTAVALKRYRDGRSTFETLALERLGGEDAWEMRAPSGEQDHDDAPLQLHAPVNGSLQRPDGNTAEWTAGQVFIEQTTERLFSNEPVQWNDAVSSARADGFDGDWDGSRVTLRGEVHVRYASPSP